LFRRSARLVLQPLFADSLALSLVLMVTSILSAPLATTVMTRAGDQESSAQLAPRCSATSRPRREQITLPPRWEWPQVTAVEIVHVVACLRSPKSIGTTADTAVRGLRMAAMCPGRLKYPVARTLD
jgi:hypothetical protein